MVFALQRAAAETTSFQTHPQDPQGGVTVTPCTLIIQQKSSSPRDEPSSDHLGDGPATWETVQPLEVRNPRPASHANLLTLHANRSDLKHPAPASLRISEVLSFKPRATCATPFDPRCHSETKPKSRSRAISACRWRGRSNR